MKTFYKIVHNNLGGSRLTSCSVGVDGEDYEVDYLPGVAVAGKNGSGLFVFKELDKAQLFAGCTYGVRPAKIHRSGNIEIWECEVTRPRPVRIISGKLDKATFDKFYELKRKHKPLLARPYARIAPQGSYICDTVKLLKKVA